MKPLPTILTALVLIITSFLLGKCSGSGDTDSGQPMSNHRVDSLNATIANLEANLQVKANEASAELALIDSFKAAGPKLVYVFDKAKNAVLPEDTVGCEDLYRKFVALSRSADSLIANRDSTIAHHEIRDSALLQVISIQHDQLTLKDSVIQEKDKLATEAVKKERKRGNRKAAGTGIGGLILGFILGKL